MTLKLRKLIMKNNNYWIVLAFLFPFIIEASERISGTSGDILAINNYEPLSVNELILKHDQSEYLIIGLPYVSQTSIKKIGVNNIEIRYKDFGESRITIEDISKVNLIDFFPSIFSPLAFKEDFSICNKTLAACSPPITASLAVGHATINLGS